MKLFESARTRKRRNLGLLTSYRSLYLVLIALIFLIGLVVRLLFVRHFQTAWYADERSQYEAALSILKGTYFGQRDPYWPPGSIVMSGVILALFHGSTRAVFYTQALMGACTVLFVEAVGRRFFGKVAGLVAAFLYAIYVPVVYYTGTFLSETTFFFCTLAAVAMLARYLDSDSRRDLIWAGILFGLSALSRPVSLPLPFLAFFLFWFRKNGWGGKQKFLLALKKTIFLLVVTFLTIMPWTIRNWIVVGDPVLIDINGGINMYIAHNPTSRGYWYQLPLNDPILQQQHTPEGEKLANHAALDYIKTHPQQTVDQFWKVNDMFWNRGDFDVDQQGIVVDQVLSRLHLPHLRFLDIKWWALSFGLLALLFRWRTALYPALFILAYNIVINLIYFAPRYRMVVEPFLLLLLAGGIQAVVSRFKNI